MKPKIKINKLRNEIATYILENMKLPKGVKAHHTINVSPKGNTAEIKLETFMLSKEKNVPVITKNSFTVPVEKNSVITDVFVSELNTFIKTSVECMDKVLTELEEA